MRRVAKIEFKNLYFKIVKQSSFDLAENFVLFYNFERSKILF